LFVGAVGEEGRRGGGRRGGSPLYYGILTGERILLAF